MSDVPTTDFDPTQPDVLADPYPYLDDLRESTPVAYAPSMGKWVLSSHANVFAAQRHPGLGRTYRQYFTDEEFGQEPPDPRWSDFWQAERWSLLELEPPDHTRLRKIVSSAFNPKRVLGLREPSSQRSIELLNDLRELPQFDLLADYAEPYSVSIISDFLGADRSHEKMFLHWAHTMVRMYEVATPEEEKVEANQSARDFIRAAQDLVDYKRKSPGDDLISYLVSAESEGGKLTDDELVSLIILILNAGHEATVNTTGNGVVALLRHPDQWHLVASGQVPARKAVDELIRWDPPLQLFERWVLKDDVEIDGVQLPFGSRIAMLYGAANRDPAVFARPEKLDITRPNSSQHVNFGGGVHACLGSPLARVELDASLTNLTQVMPNLQLVQEPVHTNAFVIWGYQSVMVSPGHNSN